VRTIAIFRLSMDLAISPTLQTL